MKRETVFKYSAIYCRTFIHENSVVAAHKYINTPAKLNRMLKMEMIACGNVLYDKGNI